MADIANNTQENVILAGEEGWQENLSICDRQKKLFLNDFLSDVTFYVGLVENLEDQKKISVDQLRRIPGHKFILIASSPVFEKMFFGSFSKGSDQSEVKVLDMEPEAFIALLRYVYCEEIEVEDEYLVQVLYGAKKYMYSKFAFIVADLLIKTLNNSNVLEVYEKVHKFEVPKLDEFIVDTIQSNTYNLIKEKSFVNIQKHTLEFILSQPKLNVSEPDLFDACIRWARAKCVCNEIANPQPQQLRQVLGDLVYLIRIFSFVPKTFISGPCESGIFTSDEMLEVILHLESNKKLKNDFVPKFNQAARPLCGSKWVKFFTKYNHCYNHNCHFGYGNIPLSCEKSKIDFSFQKYICLQGFSIQNSSCVSSRSFEELTIQNESNILFSRKNINFNDTNYEIVFDLPIVVENFSIEFCMSCVCNPGGRTANSTVQIQTGGNEITCEFKSNSMSSCIQSVSLYLY